MEPTSQPDPKQVDAVEVSLYNRMLRNAFFGFMKSAVIGAAIGLLVGGIVGAMGIPLPHMSFFGEAADTFGSRIISGALQGAMWLAGITGSFGAVAAIQSTRDTRRWFLQHENPALSPEQATGQAPLLQPQKGQSPQPSFEAIDKTTPQFLERIGKKELGMLVHMLEDYEHPALALTAAAYGYRGNDQWDEAALASYKNGRLHERMTQENYTFFLLRDGQGQVVALASGNAMEDKSQFRLMNFTIDREQRHKSYGKALMKRIAQYADEHGFAQIVMPMSQHAVAKGEAAVQQHIAEALGLETTMRPHPWDPKSVEFVAVPEKCHSMTIGHHFRKMLSEKFREPPSESARIF